MKVLVGFDDSEGAWDAIALVGVLRGFVSVEAHLLRVVAEEDALATPYRVLGSGHFPEANPLELATEALAGMEVATSSYTGSSPAHVLHDVAESEGAELVVIGSPHRGALGRTFLGSVGEALLHGAPCPLLVAPRGFAAKAHKRPRSVAIAYDGTQESKLALKYAEALPAAAGARLRVFTVLAPAVPMPSPVGYVPALGFEPAKLIEEAIDGVQGVEVEGQQLAGSPAAALAGACEEHVDLLVAGSRGYGPLGRVFAGSVTSSLICRAPCPVLIVPRSKDAEGDEPRESLAAATEREGAARR